MEYKYFYLVSKMLNITLVSRIASFQYLRTKYCFIVYENNLRWPEEQHKLYNPNCVITQQRNLLEQIRNSSFFSNGSILLTSNKVFWEVTLRLWLSSARIYEKIVVPSASGSIRIA